MLVSQDRSDCQADASRRDAQFEATEARLEQRKVLLRPSADKATDASILDVAVVNATKFTRICKNQGSLCGRINISAIDRVIDAKKFPPPPGAVGRNPETGGRRKHASSRLEAPKGVSPLEARLLKT